jgi:hypothetical protein
MSVPNIESLQADQIVAVDGVADELAKSLPWSENLAEEGLGRSESAVPRFHVSAAQEDLRL